MNSFEEHVQEYVQKFCEKHECTEEEAREYLLVQTYIKDIKERGNFEQVQRNEDSV